MAQKGAVLGLPSQMMSFVVGCNLKSKGHKILAYAFLGPLGWDAGCHSRTKGRPPALLTLSLQEERSRSEHNLVNIQKTHERMQTENKSKSLGSEEKGEDKVGWLRPRTWLSLVADRTFACIYIIQNELLLSQRDSFPFG